MTTAAKACLIGGGIGSLAAAAFMIRDGGLPGESIWIFEKEGSLGGSFDAAGATTRGYSMRGGRMFSSDNYECAWDLFKTIPSLSNSSQSVYEETVDFNKIHQSHSQARLVDRERAIVPIKSMGFSWEIEYSCKTGRCPTHPVLVRWILRAPMTIGWASHRTPFLGRRTLRFAS